MANLTTARGKWKTAAQPLAPLVAAILLPLCSGLLLAAAFPPWRHAALAWIALLPFAVACASNSKNLEAWFGAYLGGIVFHLVALDWIRTSYGGAGLSGSNVLPWLLQSVVGACFWSWALGWSRLLYHRVGVPMVLALPFGWLMLEMARSVVCEHALHSPCPWLQLGMAEAESLRFIQLADVAGVHGLSVLVAMTNGALFDLARGFWRREHRAVAHGVASAAVASIALAIALVYGSARTDVSRNQQSVTIRLMPPDANPMEVPVASRPRGEHRSPELWLWSEKAFDFRVALLSRPRGHLVRNVSPTASAARSAVSVLEMLERCSRENRAVLLIGCATSNSRDEEPTRNSVVIVDPHLGFNGVYDKIHLVQWSEHVPYFLPGLPAAVNGHIAGDRMPLFDFAADTRQITYALSICYDTCFPGLFRQYMRGQKVPDLFFIASCERSDATGTLAWWMLSHARLRAIETRRPIVRCVEGGISGLIDSNGRLVASAPETSMTKPFPIASIPLDDRRSLYVSCGDRPLLFTVLGVAGAALCMSRPGWRRCRASSLPPSDRIAAPMCKNRDAGGFTLIELLVAIAIIGVLLAITLVVVVRSRETMHRNMCQSNMRQWGLALANYSAAHTSWPPAVIWEPRGEPLGGGRFPIGVIDRVATIGDLKRDTIFANWAIMLLPYVEQHALLVSAVMTRQISDDANKHVRETVLSVTVCPSDSRNSQDNLYSRALSAGIETNRYARGNYAINAGPDQYCIKSVRNTDPCIDGFFVRGVDLLRQNDQAWGTGVAGVNKCFRPADVTDGLSQTVILDEVRCGLNEYDPRGVWALGQIGSSIIARHGKHDQRAGLHRETEPDEIVNCSILVEDVGLDGLQREDMMCNEQNTGTNTRVAARSAHGEGLNALYCDGSVHYHVRSINIDIWHALHTRDQHDRTEEN